MKCDDVIDEQFYIYIFYLFWYMQMLRSKMDCATSLIVLGGGDDLVCYLFLVENQQLVINNYRVKLSSKISRINFLLAEN